MNAVCPSTTKMLLGDGRAELFWLDRWPDGRAPSELVLEVHKLVPSEPGRELFPSSEDAVLNSLYLFNQMKRKSFLRFLEKKNDGARCPIWVSFDLQHPRALAWSVAIHPKLGQRPRRFKSRHSQTP